MSDAFPLDAVDGAILFHLSQDGRLSSDESGQRGFGASALKINGSIFATLTAAGLVMNYPMV